MEATHVKLATASNVKARLPAFVYGTLQTGFRNHNNTVRNRHSAAAPARLPGAVVLDFSVGFPGMYPCSVPAPAISTSGTLASVYPVDVLEAVRTKMDAAAASSAGSDAPVTAIQIAAKGVVGELLFFEEDAGAHSPGAGSGGPCSGVGWPAVLADLDRLEDYSGPGNPANMYERVCVEVLARRSQLPPEVAASARSAAADSPAGTAAGAGASADSAAFASAGVGAGAGDDLVWVTAWTYFCLIDVRQASLTATLVADGDWRRHMAEHKKADAADDWAAGVAPKAADATSADASGAEAEVAASGGAASMPA